MKSFAPSENHQQLSVQGHKVFAIHDSHLISPSANESEVLNFGKKVKAFN
jgi:hypothetical protein